MPEPEVFGTPDPGEPLPEDDQLATSDSGVDAAVAAALAARELDYTETSVDLTGLTSTTFAKLGGAGVLEVSFTAPALPHKIEVVIRSVTCTAGAAGTFIAALFDIDEDEMVGDEVPVSITTATAPTQGPFISERFAASSGVKNYEVRYKVITGDTFSVDAATAKASVHAFIV